MKKFFLLFSHTLTVEQKSDAKEKFGVSDIVTLPDEVQKVWSHIPPDTETLRDELLPIHTYLKQHIAKDDIVLVQGDFGATYLAVGWVKALGAVPVYATTQRNVVEKQEGNRSVKTSVFEHVRYRIYGQ